MKGNKLRHLEINGGRVLEGEVLRLLLPQVARGYADAQVDDYGRYTGNRAGRWGRAHFPYQAGVELSLRARFSHGPDQLLGTAGFGFWNAPFGDPSVRRPALPQASWFFFASAPTDLPLAEEGPGRGWFASTLVASTPSALMMAPLAPIMLILNQVSPFRRRFWPLVRRRLGISFAPVEKEMTEWHEYQLKWLPERCRFLVDGRPLLETPHSPRGPLGFVCWLDNQYLVATNRGRLSWGVLATDQAQWLDVADLEIQ